MTLASLVWTQGCPRALGRTRNSSMANQLRRGLAQPKLKDDMSDRYRYLDWFAKSCSLCSGQATAPLCGWRGTRQRDGLASDLFAVAVGDRPPTEGGAAVEGRAAFPRGVPVPPEDESTRMSREFLS